MGQGSKQDTISLISTNGDLMTHNRCWTKFSDKDPLCLFLSFLWKGRRSYKSLLLCFSPGPSLPFVVLKTIYLWFSFLRSISCTSSKSFFTFLALPTFWTSLFCVHIYVYMYTGYMCIFEFLEGLLITLICDTK